MSHVTLARSDLYSQTQAGSILGVNRQTVRELALGLKLEYKSDPTRAGKMLNRDDMARLASALNKSIDWDAIASN